MYRANHGYKLLDEPTRAWNAGADIPTIGDAWNPQERVQNPPFDGNVGLGDGASYRGLNRYDRYASDAADKMGYQGEDVYSGVSKTDLGSFSPYEPGEDPSMYSYHTNSSVNPYYHVSHNLSGYSGASSMATSKMASEIGAIGVIIIALLWSFSFLAYIFAITCTGFSGSFAQKGWGIVVAAFTGPFYWIYYLFASNDGYCQ